MMAANATNISSPMSGIHNEISHNNVRVYSPLMLNNDWSRDARFYIMILFASFGSIMNIFFIISFFVEQTLMRIGNIYHACIGLADLAVTGGVMTISALVILSDKWDNLPVCQIALITAESATYAYNLFFLMVALTDFLRICRPAAEYETFITMRIRNVCLVIFGSSLILATTGVLLDLDYDYCERRSYGSTPYRFCTSVLFNFILTLLTLFCLISPIRKYRRRAQEFVQFRETWRFVHDYHMMLSNLMVYSLFIIFWIPYVVVVIAFPDTHDAIYYVAAWMGLFRCLLTSFLYGTTNNYFKKAYASLLNKCLYNVPILSSPNYRRRRVAVHDLQHDITRDAYV